MRRSISATDVRRFITERDDLDVLRIHYCYQLGSTFTNLALMEDTIIDAMLICDRVKVASVLATDVERWDQFLAKRKHLQDLTLGNLISLLSKHGISDDDPGYLRWMKSKRDFFIHRFFHDGRWPGELEEHDLEYVCRQLLYLEKIFVRATYRIWGIFARAGLMGRHDLGENGALMWNLDPHGILKR